MNTLAYYKNSLLTVVKSFITLALNRPLSLTMKKIDNHKCQNFLDLSNCSALQFVDERPCLTRLPKRAFPSAGNTQGGSITVPLTSCLTGLDQPVLQVKTKIVSCHTADSKPVKQEVNSTVILPPLVFPAFGQPPSPSARQFVCLSVCLSIRSSICLFF